MYLYYTTNEFGRIISKVALPLLKREKSVVPTILQFSAFKTDMVNNDKFQRIFRYKDIFV